MFQISLRIAREFCGYSIEEAAEYCNTTMNTIEKIEMNSSHIPPSIVRKLLSLYGISSSGLIYFGPESDCIRLNRRKAKLKLDHILTTDSSKNS